MQCGLLARRSEQLGLDVMHKPVLSPVFIGATVWTFKSSRESTPSSDALEEELVYFQMKLVFVHLLKFSPLKCSENHDSMHWPRVCGRRATVALFVKGKRFSDTKL